MNPNLPKAKRARSAKPSSPPAAVLDIWRTARGVEAVQLLFLTSRCGCDGAVEAAQAIAFIVQPLAPTRGWLVKLVADEFKLVVRDECRLPLSGREVSDIVLELTRAMEAAGVERA